MSIPGDSHDHLDRVLFEEATILARLDELAAGITADYQGKSLTVVAVLHGSLMMMADLLRRIRLPLKMECLSVESYHGGVESSGSVKFNMTRMPELSGEHVLIVDDILDSGRTLEAIIGKLSGVCRPQSIRVAVLLDKQTGREASIEPDYVGFEIDDLFVVGYGLDYQGRYRNLPFIGTLKPEHILPEHRK
ncbi:MAG: hypoxanthine phosphoribosyltransferase [Verrucomicrobiaceae bacterium]|nr:hypoxanthine phosphoribosyltransferase [Verrucomicrobiaceae bacterium]